MAAVNCSNCGAPVDLARGSACGHCGSPLSMLDLEQTGRLVSQLREADRTDKPVDPTLPLEMARARREVEAAFATFQKEPEWTLDVGAGLSALARWLGQVRSLTGRPRRASAEPADHVERHESEKDGEGDLRPAPGPVARDPAGHSVDDDLAGPAAVRVGREPERGQDVLEGLAASRRRAPRGCAGCRRAPAARTARAAARPSGGVTARRRPRGRSGSAPRPTRRGSRGRRGRGRPWGRARPPGGGPASTPREAHTSSSSKECESDPEAGVQRTLRSRRSFTLTS